MTIEERATVQNRCAFENVIYTVTDVAETENETDDG